MIFKLTGRPEVFDLDECAEILRATTSEVDVLLTKAGMKCEEEVYTVEEILRALLLSKLKSVGLPNEKAVTFARRASRHIIWHALKGGGLVRHTWRDRHGKQRLAPKYMTREPRRILGMTGARPYSHLKVSGTRARLQHLQGSSAGDDSAVWIDLAREGRRLRNRAMRSLYYFHSEPVTDWDMPAEMASDAMSIPQAVTA